LDFANGIETAEAIIMQSPAINTTHAVRARDIMKIEIGFLR